MRICWFISFLTCIPLSHLLLPREKSISNEPLCPNNFFLITFLKCDIDFCASSQDGLWFFSKWKVLQSTRICQETLRCPVYPSYHLLSLFLTCQNLTISTPHRKRTKLYCFITHFSAILLPKQTIWYFFITILIYTVQLAFFC